MDVWKCPVCAKPLFLSTDYIFFRQIFKQQPYCDALLPIKKHTKNPDSGQEGSRGGRKLNKYSIKNLSKNILLNSRPSSSFSPQQGFPSGKWLLGRRTYALYSAEWSNARLALCTCLRPSLFLCMCVLHWTGSLMSLSLLMQQNSVLEELCFSRFWEVIIAFFFCVHSSLNLSTKFAPCARSPQIYGYCIELWFRPSLYFYSSLYTDFLNPEVPKYHKQRDFFWYFQLEQK